MIINTLHSLDCSFCEPKIIDSWELCSHRNTVEIRMFRIKVGKAYVMPMFTHGMTIDLSTLIGVEVNSCNDRYSYKAISYEENHASCRCFLGYYCVAIPENIMIKSMDLAIKKMMSIMKDASN